MVQNVSRRYANGGLVRVYFPVRAGLGPTRTVAVLISGLRYLCPLAFVLCKLPF